MRGLRSLVITGVALAATAALGWGITTMAVDAGVDRYSPGTPERAVAETAAWSAASLGRRVLLPRSLFFLLPEVRVTEIRREPGHCTEYPPGSFPHLDRVAEVRVYTLFAIPVQTFTVRCGGNFL